MVEQRKVRVGISVGDINGVGIELILKTFEDKRMLELCTPVVFASDKVISFFKKKLGLPLQTHFIHDFEKLNEEKLNIFKSWDGDVKIELGTPTKISGEKAFQSLEKATEALAEGAIDVLLTAPISKDNIQSEAFDFPGHTEYLESKIDGESLMILMSDKIRVGLVTGHIPVAKVTESLTKELIQKKIDILYQSLKQDFAISKPRIAILGLNPHCGDNGVIGNEDNDLIVPILEAYQEKGMLVYGPYAADGFFGNASYEKFDGVISMYHDQGLVGFKAVSFGEGVNFTAGLDRVRVSPDHGTAFDIAGKGMVEVTSFKKALFQGIEIFRNREAYKSLTKNVLRKQKASK